MGVISKRANSPLANRQLAVTGDLLPYIIKALGWSCLPFLLLPAASLVLPKVSYFSNLSQLAIRTIDYLCVGLGEIIKWALPLLVLTVVMSVVALSIFGLSFTKLDELPLYLHAAIIMLGSAATLIAGQHVRVDIFYSRFGSTRKAKLEILAFYALIVPVCLILIWMSQSFVSGAWRSLEGSTDTNGIRGVYLLKTLVPIFALTVLAQAFAIAARAALLLTGKTAPKRPVHIAPLFESET